MKATDLMIGDWVYAKMQVDDTGKEPVFERTPKMVTDLTNSINGIYVEGISQFAGAEIEPVPLTPEILEKNGFNKPQDAGDGTIICGMTIGPYKLTFQSLFGLPILTIENVVDNDNNHTCLVLKDEIYNVHELQHALRLCGIDKEITI